MYFLISLLCREIWVAPSFGPAGDFFHPVALSKKQGSSSRTSHLCSIVFSVYFGIKFALLFLVTFFL